VELSTAHLDLLLYTWTMTIDPNLERKTQLMPLIQSLCVEAGAAVEFLEPRRTNDLFILMVRGERPNVLEAHSSLQTHLESEEVETVAARERETGYVLSLVVMKRREGQLSGSSERRAKLQNA
jgi:hypothetical protein